MLPSVEVIQEHVISNICMLYRDLSVFIQVHKILYAILTDQEGGRKERLVVSQRPAQSCGEKLGGEIRTTIKNETAEMG